MSLGGEPLSEEVAGQTESQRRGKWDDLKQLVRYHLFARQPGSVIARIPFLRDDRRPAVPHSSRYRRRCDGSGRAHGLGQRAAGKGAHGHSGSV